MDDEQWVEEAMTTPADWAQCRWSPRRKAAAVHLLHLGRIERLTFQARFHLSDEELAEWERDDLKGTGAHRRAGIHSGPYQQQRRIS